MGYSHYCMKKEDVEFVPLAPEKRKELIERIERVVDLHKNILTGDYSGKTMIPVDVSQGHICFNGHGKYGFETFEYEIDECPPGFGFCKTGNKAYDIAVCEILLLLEHYIESLVVDSDGFKQEDIPLVWQLAAANVYDVFGIQVDLLKKLIREVENPY